MGHDTRATAIVRQHIEKIDGVTRTWFEWTVEAGALLKTLVVHGGGTGSALTWPASTTRRNNRREPTMGAGTGPFFPRATSR
jgi:hypothetical protein